MRKWKMALAGVLSLFMVEAPAVCSMPVYSVAAAETTVQDTDVLKGLVKENGKYYYYVDGKMQKWKNPRKITDVISICRIQRSKENSSILRLKLQIYLLHFRVSFISGLLATMS